MILIITFQLINLFPLEDHTGNQRQYRFIGARSGLFGLRRTYGSGNLGRLRYQWGSGNSLYFHSVSLYCTPYGVIGAILVYSIFS